MYGISSGALKAAVFAQRQPERVARLALDAFVWTGEGSPTLAERRWCSRRSWLCVLAPAAVPADILQRMHAEMGKALQEADIAQSLRAAGIAPALLGPRELGAFMRAEHEKWGRVVRETGATIN